MSQTVALFVTCLVDLSRPEIGFATIKLLEAAGCDVIVPQQGCCGQANYNSGDIKGSVQLAQRWVEQFESFDAIVIPSGSCAATISKDYIKLFERTNQQDWKARAEVCAEKTWELSSYLRVHCDWLLASPDESSSVGKGVVTYHDSCSGLRSLGIKSTPRELLASARSTELVESDLAETCCGFGGTFCIKQPEISVAMADDKINSAEKAGTNKVLGGDWGCLMHLQARAQKKGQQIEFQHYAEYLAERL